MKKKKIGFINVCFNSFHMKGWLHWAGCLYETLEEAKKQREKTCNWKTAEVFIEDK